MRCQNKTCGHELTPKEPVYRCLIGAWEDGMVRHHVIHVCATCAKTRAQWDERAKGRPSRPYRDVTYGNLHQPIWWCEPRSCEHCGRTVIQELSVKTQIIACSPQCRRDIFNASHRRAEMTVCSTCGELFTPARSGALYCSVACKQKAYRDRHR
jgi:hypothetical protein